MAEADRIEIASQACLAAGLNPITSFSQGTAEAKFCAQWYEVIVESELSLYKWRFATKTKDLSTSVLVDAPDTEYDTAYQLPSGIMSIDTVLVGDRPINYDRYQDQIHTNGTSQDTVIVKYRYRADEQYWNPYFKLLVIYRLATMLSYSIARKDDIAASMKLLADEHWRRAKTEDAQAQTNKKVSLRKITNARGGSVDKFWRRR